jgi:hypothetical protein
MAYPDLSNYKGVYSNIDQASAAMKNGTFASANPYASPSAPMGMTPVQPVSSSPISGPSAPMGMTNVQSFQPTPVQPPVQPPKPQMPTVDVNGITSRITADYQNQLAAQKQAIEQELAKIQQSNALAVTQNNNTLQDELKKLSEQKVLDDQTAINLQNRRGGFYSGGLDYQLGNIARANTDATSQAQRDIAARNADLFSKNALAAAQAAQNIQLLQSQAPDKIRSLIQQEIDRQRGINIQEAGLTGQYNGQRTLQGQQLDANKQAAEASATGYYNPSGMTADQINQEIAQNSAAYADATPEQQQQLHARNIYLNGLLGKTDSTGNGDYVGGNPNGIVGYRTTTGQQLDAQQAQRAWDNEFKNQQFTYQKAFDLWERTFKEKTFDQSVKQAAANLGLDYAKMSQAGKEFAAEMAFKQKAQQLEQDKFDFQKQNQQNTKQQEKMQKEAQGLADGLRDGKFTPAEALQRIEEDTKLGFYTPMEAAYLKSTLQTITPNLPSSKPQELTKEQQAQIPSDSQIEKDWVAAGKPGGILDYRSWYKDPNGKMAGTSFEQWMQLYGPKLS